MALLVGVNFEFGVRFFCGWRFLVGGAFNWMAFFARKLCLLVGALKLVGDVLPTGGVYLVSPFTWRVFLCGLFPLLRDAFSMMALFTRYRFNVVALFTRCRLSPVFFFVFVCFLFWTAGRIHLRAYSSHVALFTWLKALLPRGLYCIILLVLMSKCPQWKSVTK